jgi:hypothetical protein
MISSLHGLYDDRIYWKEALTLKHAGYDVIHLAWTAMIPTLYRTMASD